MKTTRRGFLRLGGAATGITALNVVSSDALGARAPSNRIAVGLIGLGGMGLADLDAVLGLEDAVVRAVCDVNRDKAAAAQSRVNRCYGKSVCLAENDFRALCARKDIDAVVIATPDHSHAAIGMEAVRNGKDVYGEPPFTHALGEGRALADAVARNKRVWQAGSWLRSQAAFQRAAALVRRGGVGRVIRVEVGLSGGGRGPAAATQPVDLPRGLDWEAWQGGSSQRPYCGVSDYHWRWVSAWGGGALANGIGHYGDIALWGLGRDSTGPVCVTGEGEYPADGIYDTATSFSFRCLFGDGLTLAVTDGGRAEKGVGVRWVGEGGDWVWVTRGGVDASRPELLTEGARSLRSDAAFACGLALERHLRDFIGCVKTRRATVAPAEAAQRAATLGHLGDLAMRKGRVIRFNPRTEAVSC